MANKVPNYVLMILAKWFNSHYKTSYREFKKHYSDKPWINTVNKAVYRNAVTKYAKRQKTRRIKPRHKILNSIIIQQMRKEGITYRCLSKEIGNSNHSLVYDVIHEKSVPRIARKIINYFFSREGTRRKLKLVYAVSHSIIFTDKESVECQKKILKR